MKENGVIRTGMHSYEAMCVLKLICILEESQILVDVDGAKERLWIGVIDDDRYGMRHTYDRITYEDIYQDFTNEVFIKIRHFSFDYPKLELVENELFGDLYDRMMTSIQVAFEEAGLPFSDDIAFKIPADSEYAEYMFKLDNIPFTVGMLKQMKEAFTGGAKPAIFQGQPANLLEIEKRRIIIDEIMKKLNRLDNIRTALMSDTITKDKVDRIEAEMKKISARLKEMKTKLAEGGYRYDLSFIRTVSEALSD